MARGFEKLLIALTVAALAATAMASETITSMAMSGTIRSSRTVVSGNERVIITPDGLFRMTPAAIVMHELVGHDIPRMVGRDTGNAVANENKVRAENGMPLRPADPTHEE